MSSSAPPKSPGPPRIDLRGAHERVNSPLAANYQRNRKVIRLVALGIFWCFAMAVPLFFLGSDRVPSGTVVSGVDIGGLDSESAVEMLAVALRQPGSEPISVTAIGKTIKLDPAELGFSLDPQATVESVRAHRLNPFDLGATLLGGDSSPVVQTIDNDKLSQAVDMLASSFEQNATEPEITYTGTQPVVSEPSTGVTLDRAGTIERLARSYLQADSGSVELPVQNKLPMISSEQAKEFAATIATAAVSEPVMLHAGTLSLNAVPADLAQSLSYSVQDGQLKPRVDGAKLHQLMATALAAVDSPAVDATWTIVKGAPVVTPSKNGSGVTDDVVFGSLVQEALAKTGPDRVVEVPLGPLAPKLSTEAATALGITEKMGTYVQSFPYAPYRTQNIGQAAKNIDRTFLTPGEVFSMNNSVGERTKANGFTVGPVVGEGGKLILDMGGGVSTATTATYLAAFYAGLEIVERGAHTIWISRYTAGLEATVAWGQLDMKFRNNTPTGVFITAKATGTSIAVTIWGKKQYDSVKAISGPRANIKPFSSETNTNANCVFQDGVPGFDIVVNRVLSKAGQPDVSEPISTHYIPAANVQCAPASAAKPTPTPTGAPTPPGVAKQPT